jgi:hypothetical protein
LPPVGGAGEVVAVLVVDDVFALTVATFEEPHAASTRAQTSITATRRRPIRTEWPIRLGCGSAERQVCKRRYCTTSAASSPNTRCCRDGEAAVPVEPAAHRLRIQADGVEGGTRTMATYRLAQCNIARLRAPLDSPVLADFVAALEPINRLADRTPGFVWRLQTEDGDATALRVFADDMLIVNMSVWESIDALARFVYHSGHRDVMRRRRQWFEKPDDAYLVLWWMPTETLPTVPDAQFRFELHRDALSAVPDLAGLGLASVRFRSPTEQHEPANEQRETSEQRERGELQSYGRTPRTRRGPCLRRDQVRS